MLDKSGPVQDRAGGHSKKRHRANLADGLPEDECAWEDEDEGSANVEPGFEFGFQVEEGEDTDNVDDGYDYYFVPEEGVLDECGYWLTSNQESLGQADADLCKQDMNLNKE